MLIAKTTYKKLISHYRYELDKQEAIATPNWKERDYQRYLANLIGGSTEVRCPVGRIDIVNNDIVCEVKLASTHGNKCAIGQALCYTHYYEGYTPAIALIGAPENSVLAEVCKDYRILYFFFWSGLWQI